MKALTVQVRGESDHFYEEYRRSRFLKFGLEPLYAVDFWPIEEGISVSCGILYVYRRVTDSVIVAEIFISHKSAASHGTQSFVDQFFHPIMTVLIAEGKQIPTELYGDIDSQSGELALPLVVPLAPTQSELT